MITQPPHSRLVWHKYGSQVLESVKVSINGGKDKKKSDMYTPWGIISYPQRMKSFCFQERESTMLSEISQAWEDITRLLSHIESGVGEGQKSRSG